MNHLFNKGWPRKKRALVGGTVVVLILMYVFYGIAQSLKPIRYKEKIELQCGKHKMVLICGKASSEERLVPYEERVCIRNSLKLIRPNGMSAAIPFPQSYVEDQGTPSGFECHLGKDSKLYWVVAYSFFSLSRVSLLHEVYTEKGRRLTVYEKRADHD